MSDLERIAIVRSSYAAFAARDRAAFEKLIADDFQFTSPLDNHIDRETYFARCWPNSEKIESFDFVHVVPDRERVLVTYDAHAGGRHFRNTEIVTVREGRIVEVEVYFGWDLPHPAPLGGFLEPETDEPR
jgi:ketosteroid isomerase-like protein